MVAYEPEPLVSEFARRTALNQQLVDAVAAPEKRLKPEDRWAHEFTQLVNSLFGLLILPHEHGWLQSIKGGFDAIGLPNDIGDTYPVRKWCDGLGPLRTAHEPTAQNLIHRMRNAFGHGHLELESDGSDLTGIRLWDINPNVLKQLRTADPNATGKDQAHTMLVLKEQQLRQMTDVVLTKMQKPE